MSSAAVTAPVVGKNEVVIDADELKKSLEAISKLSKILGSVGADELTALTAGTKLRQLSQLSLLPERKLLSVAVSGVAVVAPAKPIRRKGGRPRTVADLPLEERRVRKNEYQRKYREKVKLKMETLQQELHEHQLKQLQQLPQQKHMTKEI